MRDTIGGRPPSLAPSSIFASGQARRHDGACLGAIGEKNTRDPILVKSQRVNEINESTIQGEWSISFDRSRSFDTQTHSFVSWNNNPYSIHISVIYIPSNKYLFFYVCKIVYMHASSYFITHYCNLSYHRDFPCLLRACEPVVWYGIPVLREANKRIACALVTHSFALLHQIIQKDREQISHENLNTFRLTFIQLDQPTYLEIELDFAFRSLFQLRE